MERLQSLDVIRGEVDRQLDVQLRHFEGVDAKAGVILGFSAAFVALTTTASQPLLRAGTILAGIAALLALSAFWPRRYPIIDLLTFRTKYLNAEPSFTAIHLLDTKIQMENQAKNLVHDKAGRLEASLVFLTAAVSVAIVSIILR